ncbi:MAG: NADH-quinone oxidoreductase subunit N [Omnitrophica WOR_2 bacterium]
MFETSVWMAILPEILLLALGLIVLFYDLTSTQEEKHYMGWLTAGGLAAILITALAVARPGTQPQALWGGMIRHDWLGFVFQMLFIFGAAITSLFAIDNPDLGKRGEFYLLLLASTLGMNLMASAGDLIMLYLAIETTSIPLYVLAGFLTRDEKSTESGFKYLLYGTMASVTMVYGFSLLYGFSGTTNINELASIVVQGKIGIAPLVGSLLLIMVGFGFKVSAVPFHFWAPDVYEGAPTPVAGFLSTASKAAGFAVLVRFLMTIFPAPATMPYWTSVVAIMSVATMTLGNSLALAQKNIKRLLAYSSIAHAGYLLIGLVVVSNLGITAIVFDLAAYLITNLAAFVVVATFWRVVGSDDISAYAGLSRRAPGLSLVLMVAILSLAGMPPLGGFVGKLFLFAAAVQANYVWLAIVGVLNSIIGLYYYMTVLKVVYLYRSDDEDKPLPVTRPYAIALGVCTLGIILIGTVFAPWFSWATSAAAALF